MAAITCFRDKYFFLSNFAIVEIGVGGLIYPSVEHAYQAAKTDLVAMKSAIRMCGTPGLAKKMGRSLKLPKWWTEDYQIETMRNLLELKFRNPDFAELLLKTKGQTIVEGNEWGDQFWGMCNGVGLNWLGRLLMERRQALINESAYQKFADVEDLI